MFVLATPIVDWNAMWKIFLVALAAGAGVVVMFGFVLLGLKIADRSGPAEPAAPDRELGGLTLAVVCALICAGVVVIGVYAMTKKPSSKPAKPKSALVIPAAPPAQLVASSR